MTAPKDYRPYVDRLFRIVEMVGIISLLRALFDFERYDHREVFLWPLYIGAMYYMFATLAELTNFWERIDGASGRRLVLLSIFVLPAVLVIVVGGGSVAILWLSDVMLAAKAG